MLGAGDEEADDRDVGDELEEGDDEEDDDVEPVDANR